MGPTWVLLAPDGPHVGPRNLAIRGNMTHLHGVSGLSLYLRVYGMISPIYRTSCLTLCLLVYGVISPIYRTSCLTLCLLVYGVISPIYRTSCLTLCLLVYGMISPIYRTSQEWHTCCILQRSDEWYLTTNTQCNMTTMSYKDHHACDFSSYKCLLSNL